MSEGKCMAGLKSEAKAPCEAHVQKCELVRPECLDTCMPAMGCGNPLPLICL